MSQRGRASVSSTELDSTEVPVRRDQGMLAVKLGRLMVEDADMRVHITATAAMLLELIRIVGTPAYMLIFLQFLREVDLARAWLGAKMVGHPHDFMDQVPLHKEGSYRSLDFGNVRAVMSAGFLEKCDSFYSLLARLQNSCTGDSDDQLFRFLCEVQVLLDLLVVCVR